MATLIVFFSFCFSFTDGSTCLRDASPLIVNIDTISCYYCYCYCCCCCCVRREFAVGCCGWKTNNGFIAQTTFIAIIVTLSIFCCCCCFYYFHCCWFWTTNPSPVCIPTPSSVAQPSTSASASTRGYFLVNFLDIQSPIPSKTTRIPRWIPRETARYPQTAKEETTTNHYIGSSRWGCYNCCNFFFFCVFTIDPNSKRPLCPSSFYFFFCYVIVFFFCYHLFSIPARKRYRKQYQQ